MLQFKMLARAVDAGERLLVQQAGEAVFRRHPPQHLHRHHLVIGGDVGVLEDRRDFGTGSGATSLWRVLIGTPTL